MSVVLSAVFISLVVTDGSFLTDGMVVAVASLDLFFIDNINSSFFCIRVGLITVCFGTWSTRPPGWWWTSEEASLNVMSWSACRTKLPWYAIKKHSVTIPRYNVLYRGKKLPGLMLLLLSVELKLMVGRMLNAVQAWVQAMSLYLCSICHVSRRCFVCLNDLLLCYSSLDIVFTRYCISRKHHRSSARRSSQQSSHQREAQGNTSPHHHISPQPRLLRLLRLHRKRRWRMKLLGW